MRWYSDAVACGICNYKWDAVYPDVIKALRCPRCDHKLARDRDTEEVVESSEKRITLHVYGVNGAPIGVG